MTKKQQSKKKYIIKGSNGTYYKQWTAIGPCFGATKIEAQKFDTKIEAELEITRHYGFIGSIVQQEIDPDIEEARVVRD